MIRSQKLPHSGQNRLFQIHRLKCLISQVLPQESFMQSGKQAQGTVRSKYIIRSIVGADQSQRASVVLSHPPMPRFRSISFGADHRPKQSPSFHSVHFPLIHPAIQAMNGSCQATMLQDAYSSQSSVDRESVPSFLTSSPTFARLASPHFPGACLCSICSSSITDRGMAVIVAVPEKYCLFI